MDIFFQSIAVLVAFAAVHERAIELIRALRGKLGRGRWKKHFNYIIDSLTIGSMNVVTATILAIVTHADLLALFRPSLIHPDVRGAVEFFDDYMSWPWQHWSEVPHPELHLTGCVLMGFAAALGSQFWHDLARSVMDFRGRLQAVSSQAAASPAPPPTRPPDMTLMDNVLTPSRVANPLAPLSPPSVRPGDTLSSSA